MDTVITIDAPQPRDTLAVECPKCHGFAAETGAGDGPTQDELREHQFCGRPWACCINAFVCKLCGQRIIAQLESPEEEW